MIGVQTSTVGCADPEGATAASDPSAPIPIVDTNLDILCVRYAIANDLTPYDECDLSDDELDEVAEIPELTDTVVASAFRELPLPVSTLIVQPPNGRTLVNFETNFYTDNKPFRRSLTLLGQRVELDITPAEYAWSFGDGTTSTSMSPGAAYPDLEITHNYTEQGDYRTRLDTTYTADYRINGGTSRSVPGSVTITGTPTPLEAVIAEPKLVG